MSNKQNLEYVVGLRQVLREMKKANVSQIVLAHDAEENYKNTILKEAKIRNVTVKEYGTSKSIAQEYGIKVPSSVVGFLKNQ